MSIQNTQQQPDPVLFESNLTDAGNMECFVALHGHRFRHCRYIKKWLVWDGVRWKVDASPDAMRSALAVVRQRGEASAFHYDQKRAAKWAKTSEGLTRLNALLTLAGYFPPITTLIDQYDTDPMLLGCANVYIDLHSGQAQPPDPRQNVTMQIGCAYDPLAQCPVWLQFLDDVFEGNHELIKYMQRVIGYLLTGDMREQKMWIFYGPLAENGKSTFLDIISLLMGDYAATAAFSTFDSDRHSEKTNDLANLRGKRFIAISEINEAKRLDEARIKSVTGFRDKIRCRKMYEEEIEYLPTFKIFLAVNHLPGIRGTDNGIWRRIQVVPFNRSFQGIADKTLPEKLSTELSGILNWALEGLHEWRSQGLNPPQCITDATAIYRTESDMLGQFLAEECTLDDPAGYTLVNEFYQAYVIWLQNRGERFPPKDRSVERDMTLRGLQRIDKYCPTKKRAYQGLVLNAMIGGIP